MTLTEDVDKRVIDNFRASDIDEQGFWILPNGHKVDLINVELHLPNGRGHEMVLANICKLDAVLERHNNSTLCKTNLESGLIILLEKHHYLLTRCCNKLFLYENQKISMEAWA